MNLSLLSNGSVAQVVHSLRKALRTYAKATWAVAYISRWGVDSIRSQLRFFLEQGGQLEIFTTGKDYVTHPSALKALLALGVQTIRFQPPEYRWLFHGKVFLFESPHEPSRLIVGSSNLSQGGLSDNDEVGVQLDGPAHSSIFGRASRLLASYRRNSGFVDLEPSVLDAYSMAWQEGHARPRTPTPKTRSRLQKAVTRARTKESKISEKKGDSRYRINVWWPSERKHGDREDAGDKLYFQMQHLAMAKKLRPGDRVFLYETKVRPNADHLPGRGKVFALVEVVGRLTRRKDPDIIWVGHRRISFTHILRSKQLYFVHVEDGIPYEVAKKILDVGNFRFPGGLSRPLDLSRAKDLEVQLRRIPQP